MKLLLGFLLLFGFISLLYYGLIISYAGTSTSFSWFWLCLGVTLFVFYFMMKYRVNKGITFPGILRNIVLVIIMIGACVFIFVEATLIYYANQKAENSMEYIIVLGAQVKGTRVSKTLQKRLNTAVSYLDNNPSTLVIVSGGQGRGEDISEAEAMKRYLLAEGIEEHRILMEDKSTNTNENILFSKVMMKNEKAAVAIVTSGFHVYRAVSIAKKQGLSNVQGLAAPSETLLILNYYVREVAAVLKDKLIGNI